MHHNNANIKTNQKKINIFINEKLNSEMEVPVYNLPVHSDFKLRPKTESCINSIGIARMVTVLLKFLFIYFGGSKRIGLTFL